MVYVAVAIPVLVPFSFQSYTGEEPPFTAVAVNVTGKPEQAGLADALMDTVGVALVTTVIVTEFEVAIAGEAQLAFDVSTQVITSLFTRAAEE